MSKFRDRSVAILERQKRFSRGLKETHENSESSIVGKSGDGNRDTKPFAFAELFNADQLTGMKNEDLWFVDSGATMLRNTGASGRNGSIKYERIGAKRRMYASRG